MVYVFIRSTNMQYIALSQPFLFKVYLISVLPHIANHSKILILAGSFEHQSCLIYLAGRLVWKTLSRVLILEPLLPNFHDTLSPPSLETIFLIHNNFSHSIAKSPHKYLLNCKQLTQEYITLSTLIFFKSNV